MKFVTGSKMETCDIVRIAQRIENMKFAGMISEYSKFCEGYNEAINHVLEVILEELQKEIEKRC